jgi:hypothetical protein
VKRKRGKSKFGGEGQEHPRARTKRAQLRLRVIAAARKLIAGDTDAQVQLQLALTELDNHEKKHGEW